MPIATLDEIRSKVGQPVGFSDWIEVGQDRITPSPTRPTIISSSTSIRRRAARGFGGTIAHGFLPVVAEPHGRRRHADPGYDPHGGQLRPRPRPLPRPVKAGKRVRGHFTLDGVDEKAPGQLLIRQTVSVEIEGEDKPALTAQWLGLIFT
jgi:acyl dehydratase